MKQQDMIQSNPSSPYAALYRIDLEKEEMITFEINNWVAKNMSAAVKNALCYHDIMLQFMYRYVEKHYMSIFLRETFPWVIKRRLEETDRYEVPIQRYNTEGVLENVRVVFYRSEQPNCAIMGLIKD